jgi:hypothetical protein
MALTNQQLQQAPYNEENLWFEEPTIASGAAVSDGFATMGRVVVGIVVEGTWTAASLGFQGSIDGVNWYPDAIDAGGNFIQCTPTTGAGGSHIAFPQNNAIKIPYLRLTSVAAGTATGAPQSQSTPVIVILSRFLGGS